MTEIVKKDISKEKENYELTDNKVVLPDKDNGKFIELRQIRAIKDIGVDKFGGSFAKKGDLGGFIQSERNLNPESEAWARSDVLLYGDTEIKNGFVRNSVLEGKITIDGGSIIVGAKMEGKEGSIDINGSKIFGENGSIEIVSTGSLIIENLDIRNSGESSLKIVGDGIIEGKHNFEEVKSEKSSVNELKKSERT